MLLKDENPTDARRLLTEQEIARLYSVSLPYLRKKRLTDEGPPYLKIGRMVRYRLQDVEDFFNSHLVSKRKEAQ